MEEWKECRLKDIVEINPTESLKKGTVAKKIGMDVLQPYCRAIPSFSFEPYTGGTKFKNGDTIMARITPCLENGKTAMVNILDDNEIGFGSTEYIVFRAKNNITDPYFIYYLVTSDCIRNPAIKSMVGSSGRQRVQTDVVANLSINLPPLPTQQKIAAILSFLDDKIELNNKINTNLEQQAQALFKNWFLDFEPFGGKMPEGWKVGTIGDLCSTISKTYKGNDSHVVLINTSDVENGTILNHNSVPNSKLKGQFKKTFQKGDILYSEIRPANKHYAFVDIETTSNYIASTKLMVIRPNEGINPHYLYHILTNPDLIQEMQHLAETCSGTFSQITFESELSTYQIPLLPKEEQDKLGELFEKIDNQIFHNIEENKQLSTIRDTLLPKLMSSELDVKFVKI